MDVFSLAITCIQLLLLDLEMSMVVTKAKTAVPQKFRNHQSERCHETKNGVSYVLLE